jgi:hypothetical protein
MTQQIVEMMVGDAFSYDRSTAIGNAVREAKRDHAGGLDVILCSQQEDGTFMRLRV